MTTYPDHILRMGSQQLAELKRKAAEFERQLWDAHESLEHEVAQSFAPEAPINTRQEAFHRSPGATEPDGAGGALAAGPVSVRAPADPGYAPAEPAEPAYTRENRTADLVNHGRHGAKRRHRFRGILLAGAAAAAVAALATVLVLDMSRPKPEWPASVAQVQREIAVACQNPDIASEPSQVNFACAKGSRQILWVFSLLTSGNNPDYASIKTGRQGLEPITPAQGGDVAWSLNLHHPYDPANPIDSLEVAARAINNIIGGATLTAANGKPVVQSGLQSVSANCERYTGSAAVTSRHGFPDRCAKPISGAAGLGYLVADVFQKWVVGAPPSAAQNAAVLFQNARNPGDPRVRAILRSLQSSKLPG
ncbi:MAG TPA: hypothetical protein VGI05_01855 [Streptosporangiaceae bacterium]